MIESFIRKFTDMPLNHVMKIGRQYFQVFPELKDAVETINKNLDREPFTAGVFLGEEKRNKFLPSIALIDIISRATDKWVTVDDNAEWLFLCGRDIFGKSVVKANVKKGMVLVGNKDKEVLGYGKITGNMDKPDQVYITNILDKGDFLRREMSKKKKP